MGGVGSEVGPKVLFWGSVGRRCVVVPRQQLEDG